jgi:3-deoxy-manno-octulosonate cytidylyltransferase (CMP-KDO synthetase)
MQTIAVIPSRYGSSRLAGKPLELICGQPMIQRVYQRIQSAQCIQQVYVATDDDRIVEAVRNFGGRALMTSATLRSGTDRVAEAAAILNLARDDIVINVQGDQPLIAPSCLDQVVQPLLENTSIGMSTLAFEITDPGEYTNPKDCKVIMDRHGRALYFSRAPIPFARDSQAPARSFKHLGIYAYRVYFLERFSQLPTGYLEETEKLEQLRALEFGHPIQVVITLFDSPEVDLPGDIRRIEKILQEQNGN